MTSNGAKQTPDIDHRLSEVVVTMARLVLIGDEPGDLARETVLAAATALNADRCEVLRPAPGGKRLLRMASCGEDAAQGGRDTLPRGISSIAGYALLCEAPIVSGDLQEEKRFGTVGAPRRNGVVSAVAAPFSWHDDCGVLVAYAAREGAFDSSHALSVGHVTSLFGKALQRLQERRDLSLRAEKAEILCHPAAEKSEKQIEREDFDLTERQLGVLKLMADGCSAKQIASALSLSIHTVHSHQRNLYRTLGVGSSAGALKRAGDLRLLEPRDQTTGTG